MAKKWKALRINEDTHQRIKVQAAAAGQTIDEYLCDVIVERDYLLAKDIARGKSLPNATHAAAEAANLRYRQAMRDHEKEG